MHNIPDHACWRTGGLNRMAETALVLLTDRAVLLHVQSSGWDSLEVKAHT